MKLAEALIRRKALKEDLEQLASRLKRIAKVQEGVRRPSVRVLGCVSGRG